MADAFPTAHDKPHISVLAQRLVDVAQEYARDNSMTWPGVISAFATAIGGLLARAYDDQLAAADVAATIPEVAMKMVATMHEYDPVIIARQKAGRDA